MAELKQEKVKIEQPLVQFEQLEKNIQIISLNSAIANIDRDIQNNEFQIEEDNARKKYFSRINLHYYRNWSYAITCIIFFFIGAPLGAIVKKGGIGMPVIMSIIVFIFILSSILLQKISPKVVTYIRFYRLGQQISFFYPFRYFYF